MFCQVGTKTFKTTRQQRQQRQQQQRHADFQDFKRASHILSYDTDFDSKDFTYMNNVKIFIHIYIRSVYSHQNEVAMRTHADEPKRTGFAV